jgi:hypothetical protein
MTTVLGVFPDRSSTEEAVEHMISKGVERSHIGVIWRDKSVRQPEEVTVMEYVDHFDTPAAEAGKGAFGGAVAGGVAGAGTVLLASAGIFLLPGIGAVLAAGTAAAAAAAAAAGVVGGSITGGLIGALLGATDHDATEVKTTRTWYHDVIERDGFVAIIEAADADLDASIDALRSAGGEDIAVLEGPDGQMRRVAD